MVHADSLPTEQAAPDVSARAAPFTPAHANLIDIKHAGPVEIEQAYQAAPLQDKDMAAQDAASGTAADAGPSSPAEAVLILAEQAEPAAPAQANQMAAQEGAPAAVKNADPSMAELAAPTAAEQAEPAAAKQAARVYSFIDTLFMALSRGRWAASVSRRGYHMHEASRLLPSKSLQPAAEELPLLLQHDIDAGWRETRCLVVLLRMPVPDAIHSFDMLCIYANSSHSSCSKLCLKPLHTCKARYRSCYHSCHPSFEDAPRCAGAHSITIVE